MVSISSSLPILGKIAVENLELKSLTAPKMSRPVPIPEPLTPRYNSGVSSIIREFEIRDFQAKDFDALWRIDQGCFPPGISYSRTELKIYMRRRASFTLVAVRTAAAAPSSPDLVKAKKHSPASPAALALATGEIAGFIVAEAGNPDPGHIITIDVVAPARRFGVGSLLLRAAEDRLRVAECHAVALETAVDNLPALSFYKRHGYSVVKTFPRYYANGVDALVLTKELDAAS